MIERIYTELAFRAQTAPISVWVGAIVFLILVIVILIDWQVNMKAGG